jgi:tRNA(Ile)-lysidine synthase
MNHGLRKDAQRDQKFVQKEAKRLQLPFTTETVFLKKKLKRGSIEEIAREIRQKSLIKAAKKNKAAVIALGHTRDDLAETVLMRLLRGTGLSGIRAILPKREMRGIVFVRPLIETKRSEVEHFLKKRGLTYRTDVTNKQKRFFRNKIRLELLPHLEKNYNKNIREILTNLCRSAAIDYEYLEREGRRLLKDLAKKTGASCVELDYNRLLDLHLSQLRMVLRTSLEKLQGDTRRLTLAHIDEVEDLLRNRPLKSVVHLPNKITERKEYNRIVFQK